MLWLPDVWTAPGVVAVDDPFAPSVEPVPVSDVEPTTVASLPVEVVESDPSPTGVLGAEVEVEALVTRVFFAARRTAGLAGYERAVGAALAAGCTT